MHRPRAPVCRNAAEEDDCVERQPADADHDWKRDKLPVARTGRTARVEGGGAGGGGRGGEKERRKRSTVVGGARGGGVTRFMHSRSLQTIDLAPLQRQDSARRVFTDQADIACTKSEALCGVRRVARRVSGILVIPALSGGLPHLVRTFLRMDDSAE